MMVYDIIKIIEDKISSGEGDTGRLRFILNSLMKGKQLYLSDKKYLEGLISRHTASKHSLERDEPGILVTLSESPEEIKSDFGEYGWDIQRLVDEGKLLIIDARPFKIKDDSIELDESLYRGETAPFMHLTQLILNSVKRLQARRVVVDSLTVLEMQYANKFNARQGMQAMIHALENEHCTSLLISEDSGSGIVPTEWHVASGVILLNYLQREDAMERTIQVVKMRGVRHSEQIYPIKLGEAGLELIHPRLTP